MSNRIVWREFSKTDWYGYAGATSFRSNAEVVPLIGDIHIIDVQGSPRSMTGHAIYDAEGLTVEVSSVEGFEERSYVLRNALSRIIGRTACLLPAELTEAELIARGFEKISE